MPLLLFGAAAQRVPMVTLGLLQYIAPTTQFLLGVLLLGEPMGLPKLLGFALVWTALAVFTYDLVAQRRRAVRPAPSPSSSDALTRSDVPLAPLTTLGLGGPARRLVTAYDEDEVVDAVLGARARPGAAARRRQQPGGRPTRASTALVVHVASHGLAARTDGDDVLLTAQAGEDWDAPRRARRRRRASPGSRRCRASPAGSARPRCRTSARTARTSRRSSSGCGRSTAPAGGWSS